MSIWDEPTTNAAMHMARLFQGRTDAVGADHGGCVRINGEDDFVAALNGHLLGTEGMGAYPTGPDGTTWWGCVDIDTDDLGLARNIVRLLDKLGVTAWLERSRSKGWHVWVFASAPVPAATMRRALLAVGQILKADLPEVNPKQETLADGSVGNYVRLPYLGAEVELPQRQVVVFPDNLEPIPLKLFLRQALGSRTTPAALARAADLYRPPAPPAPVATEPTEIAHADRYVRAALEGEYADVSSCASGGRNQRLYESALKLGRFLATSQATASDLEDTLLRAADANGLLAEDGEHSVLATIRSGLRNGEARHA